MSWEEKIRNARLVVIDGEVVKDRDGVTPWAWEQWYVNGQRTKVRAGIDWDEALRSGRFVRTQDDRGRETLLNPAQILSVKRA